MKSSLFSDLRPKPMEIHGWSPPWHGTAPSVAFLAMSLHSSVHQYWWESSATWPGVSKWIGAALEVSPKALCHPERAEKRSLLAVLLQKRKRWWEAASVFGLVSVGTIQLEIRSNDPDGSGQNPQRIMTCLAVSFALIIALPKTVSYTVFPLQHPVRNFFTIPRSLKLP